MLKIVENLWAVGAPPEPAGGAHSTPPDLLAGGERVAASHKTPLSAFGRSVLLPPL